MPLWPFGSASPLKIVIGGAHRPFYLVLTCRTTLPTRVARSLRTKAVGRSDEVNAVKVLIVEDDPSIAESLREGLERHGYDVEHTESGREAVDLAARLIWCCSISDFPMSTGRTSVGSIRDAREVPIIVLTARGDEIDRVLLLELGADDYLVKPFGFRELVARIGAVTRRT